MLLHCPYCYAEEASYSTLGAHAVGTALYSLSLLPLHPATHSAHCPPNPAQIGQRLSDAAFAENLPELEALVKGGADINTHDNVSANVAAPRATDVPPTRCAGGHAADALRCRC